MNQPRPFPEEHIDELVRLHLARQEQQVDAAKVLAGVRARLQEPAAGPARSRQRRWRLALAAAAVLLIGLLSSLPWLTRSASAQSWVQEAQLVHAQPVDRCYLVQCEPDPSVLERYRMLPASPRGQRLWTRGDRFWMEPDRGDRSWAWGRDEKGRVWFAAARRYGFRFEREEVPEQLALACELRSMRVETLLKEVQGEAFELKTGEQTSQDGIRVQVVEARLKPGMVHPALRSARLEIDAQTKVLRRVVLERTFHGQRAATVSFTLAETRSQDDSRYRLDGHLEKDAAILLREPPQQRLNMLRKQLGTMPSRRFPDKGPPLHDF
jgi:hypothetical protein